MAKRYAQVLVEMLERQGVRRIYGVVGDSLNPIVDALRDSSIEWVHVRNEEAAAFAAGAESLITGELAVCAASCGPGNTHLVQGLYDAKRNRAKVLAIASHIPSMQIGSNFFQETHPEKLFAECADYCEMANSAEQAEIITHHAIQKAVANSSVSVLVVPGDVSDQTLTDGRFSKSVIAKGAPVLHPDRGQLQDLADAVNKAKTITLFCGAGVKNAREEVLELARKIKSPIGHAFGGKMYIQYDNPFDVGMSGLLGYGACNNALQEADLVILIGTDFPYNDFLPSKNVAQIDVDGSSIGHHTTVHHPVVGDAAATIADLLPLVQEKTDRSFLDKKLREHAKLLEGVVDAYASNVDHHVPIHPEYAATVIDELAAEDAVFTVDTGMCNVWAARYITPNGKREEIGSFRHGTMANALSQSIGVQAAEPDRQVIAFCGDGGLGMLMGELLTVKLHNLPVKMMCFNNSSLGMVKLEMLVAGMPEYETDHEQVNYADVATAIGIKAIRVEDPRDLRNAIAEAFAYDGPVLVDIVTDPNALSIPPEISWSMLMGFSKAASRTVLGGGIGHMINMARSNLRNIPKSTSQF